MKTTISGLRTTIYFVDDLNSAKIWYAKAFEVQPYFDEPFYVGFDIGGFELGLQPQEKPANGKAESVVAFWGVHDIEAEFNRLVALGATASEKPAEVGEGIWVATLLDPWGNRVGLIFNPHFKIKP